MVYRMKIWSGGVCMRGSDVWMGGMVDVWEDPWCDVLDANKVCGVCMRSSDVWMGCMVDIWEDAVVWCMWCK